MTQYSGKAAWRQKGASWFMVPIHGPQLGVLFGEIMDGLHLCWKDISGTSFLQLLLAMVFYYSNRKVMNTNGIALEDSAVLSLGVNVKGD